LPRRANFVESGVHHDHGLMGSEELPALQTPLKERYRADPESAVVTLSATGELGDGISC
jgi:hypothetical protein